FNVGCRSCRKNWEVCRHILSRRYPVSRNLFLPPRSEAARNWGFAHGGCTSALECFRRHKSPAPHDEFAPLPRTRMSNRSGWGMRFLSMRTPMGGISTGRVRLAREPHAVESTPATSGRSWAESPRVSRERCQRRDGTVLEPRNGAERYEEV